MTAESNLGARLSLLAPWWTTWLTVLFVGLVALATVKWHENAPLCSPFRHLPVPYLVVIDSEKYLAMAEGRVAEVESPFSKRALHPWLASKLAGTFGMPLSQAFLILSVLSFLVLAYTAAELLRRVGLSPFWAILLLLTPLILEGLLLGYLSDNFHMALTALFFLLLLSRKNFWALAVLLVAFLARESTLLLCLACIGLAWWRRERGLMVGGLVVLLAGLVCSSAFARKGLPNIHHLPDILYLALKVPYNFLLNICGLAIWSDVRTDVGVPFVTWDLPSFLHIGADRKVGLCFRWNYPLHTLLTLFTIFGSGTLFLLRTLRGGWRRLNPPFAVELAMIYGSVAFFLGVSLGDWIERLLGYGWPAFWIAVPYVMARSGVKWAKKDVVVLAMLHVAIVWWGRLAGYDRSNPQVGYPALIPCAILALWLARLRWPKGENSEQAPLVTTPS